MVRRRTALLLGTLAIAIVLAVAAAGASAATIEVRNTAKGEVLTDANGFTLFMFSLDMKKMDHCQSITSCTHVWPPLTVEGTPTAGPGINPAKLGTTTLEDGAHQVVYKGHPLYGYTGDKNPEETFYVGALAFGGYWYALSPQGRRVGHRLHP